MRPPRNQQNRPQQIGICPYENLFIYYLKGRLVLDSRTAPINFIGNWEEGEDSILFFSCPADRQVQMLLHQQPQLELVDNYQMPYDQWLGEKFKSFAHGAFRIMPPWEITAGIQQTDENRLPIVLDPGLVFGTGTHPTTRDCLEALEMAAGAMPKFSAVDLGTGTGLLALAAARLGGQCVIGIDLNPLAAKTAARNARLNRLESRVLIAQGRAEEMTACPTDLLIANIHYDVMQDLIKTKGFLAKKRFILSGLMRGEAKHIANKLHGYPVKILKHWTQDGIWHTIYGKGVSKSCR
jgi:ribosomal protein L11 methyltransferase